MVQDSISKYQKNTDLSVKKSIIDGRYFKSFCRKKYFSDIHHSSRENLVADRLFSIQLGLRSKMDDKKTIKIKYF
ncbi:hypothetical protein GKR76_10680 [Providencia alcalifaciens]|nr:hypothetical protein [Providencia alcalifaciens]